MVVDVLLLGDLEDLLDFDLDEFNRPKLIFGQTIHDNCPRRGHFENGEFVYKFGRRRGQELLPLRDRLQGSADVHELPDRALEQACELVCRVRFPVHRLRCDFNWVDMNAPFLNRSPGHPHRRRRSRSRRSSVLQSAASLWRPSWSTVSA